jgi:hypothetical protein
MIHCTQKRWVCLEPGQLIFFPNCLPPNHAGRVSPGHSAVRSSIRLRNVLVDLSSYFPTIFLCSKRLWIR